MAPTDGRFFATAAPRPTGTQPKTKLGDERRQISPKNPRPMMSPPGDTHVAEVGCSPGFGHRHHIRHQFPVGPSEVVGRVPIVVTADPAEVFAQLLGHLHRHLPGSTEADGEFGILDDPDAASALRDGQRAGDLHGEGGRDPFDLEKTPIGTTWLQATQH